MTRSAVAWPCSSKASARAWALPRPLKNTTSPANAITRFWPPFMKKVPRACSCKLPDPKPITDAPIRSCAWSSAAASWIRILRLKLSLRKSASRVILSVSAVSNESSPITACKKKLYTLNPANPPQFVQTQRTRKKQRSVPADPKSLERQVRQLLADKISGNQLGIWLLLPEHLRLGTWDLMRSWSGLPPERVEPRLALHLVNEAAMCLCSYRQRRTLSQKGFELANGLPFVPTDVAIHDLLQTHTVQDAQQLQIALGKLRRAGGHFAGTLLALDPHRMTSYSKRQMRRHRFSAEQKPAKMAQTFFLLDCHTGQPVCFSLSFFGPIGGASQPRTVAAGGPDFGPLSGRGRQG